MFAVRQFHRIDPGLAPAIGIIPNPHTTAQARESLIGEPIEDGLASDL